MECCCSDFFSLHYSYIITPSLQDDDDHIDANIPHLSMRDRVDSPPQESTLLAEHEAILAQYSDRQEAGVSLDVELPAHDIHAHVEYMQPETEFTEPHSEEVLTEGDDDVCSGIL